MKHKLSLILTVLALAPAAEAQITCNSQQTVNGVTTTSTQCNTSTTTTLLNGQPVDPTTSAVTSLYGSVLGRTPDASGLGFWSQAVGQGWSLSSVRGAFASSPEATQKISALYQTYLGRQPDPGGLQYYQQALANGYSLSQVKWMLQTSPEARSYLAR